MGKTLYEKVFERHMVATLPSGQHQLFMGLHLLHEVTSPQAFSSLDERGWKIDYQEYEGKLPSRMRLTYPDIELRLAISKWQ